VSNAEGQERPGPERGCNREQRFAIKEAAKIITFKVLFFGRLERFDSSRSHNFE
jgi:hypothetical protein